MGRSQGGESSPREDKPAEFHSDEQKDAYLAALKREKEGYEFRLEKAKVDENELVQRQMQNRIDQVEAELSRAAKASAGKAK